MNAGTGRPALVRLRVAGDPAAWRAAGFEVAGDAVCTIGSVAVELAGSTAGRRIMWWQLRDAASTHLDGLPTELPAAPEVPAGATHPNGAEAIDHVVAFSPDLERTITALRAAGLDFRRLREGPTPAGAQRQAFFRVGEAILEVVEHPQGTPAAEDRSAPSVFYGLALATADIEHTARALGPLLGDVRDAVQQGRRIATVRRDAGLGLPLAFMTR